MTSECTRHTGVFVELSAIIGTDSRLNAELVEKLREVAKTRPVMVMSDSSTLEIQELLDQYGLEFSFVLKSHLKGAMLESVVSDLDEAEFCKFGIVPEQFTKVDPWKDFRPVIIFVGPDDEMHIEVKVTLASTKEAISEELKRAGYPEKFTVVDGMDEGKFPEEIQAFFEKFARVWEKLGKDDRLAIERVMTVLAQKIDHFRHSPALSSSRG